MKAKIEIDCESGRELIVHLRVITTKLKKIIKEAKTKDIKKPIKLSDNNCYGVHTVVIKEFGVDDLID